MKTEDKRTAKRPEYLSLDELTPGTPVQHEDGNQGVVVEKSSVLKGVMFFSHGYIWTPEGDARRKKVLQKINAKVVIED